MSEWYYHRYKKQKVQYEQCINEFKGLSGIITHQQLFCLNNSDIYSTIIPFVCIYIYVISQWRMDANAFMVALFIPVYPHCFAKDFCNRIPTLPTHGSHWNEIR